MSQAISDFSGVFKGGARPNRFKVVVTGGGSSFTDLEFLCRSATQPASTLGEVAVPYQGRTYKIPGDRTFEDWTITVYNDNDHSVRKELEKWHDRMNKYEENTTTGSMASIMGNATVTQQDQNAGMLHEYQLEGIWPSEIGAIDLAWDNNDAIEEFTVTWKVQYIKPGHI
jgi:hypothetical protein